MKTLTKIVIFSLFICLLLVQIPSNAQESFLYSVRAQKDLTNHNLSDFSDAKSVTINSGLYVKELFVKNSESNLFLGFRVQKDLLGNSSLLGIAVVFDVDHDQKFADDVKILYLNETVQDGYFYQNSALSLQGNSYFSGSVHQVTYIDGKTYNLFEFTIPFNPNSNPTTDMFIPDPSDYMLGFDFVEIRNDSLISWTRGNLTTEKTINQLDSSSSSFYTMILAGPGKYAVPDFNPVVTSSSQVPASSTASLTEAYYANKSAASPGFEVLLAIPALVIFILGKKFVAMRSKK